MASIKVSRAGGYTGFPLIKIYSGSKKTDTTVTLRADYIGVFSVGDTFGFQYNTVASASGATDVSATDVSASKYFYANLTSLTAETKYYYRTWKMVSGGSKVYSSVWGDFIMNPTMTVTTVAASDIAETIATLNATYANKYPGVLFDKIGFYVNSSASESGATIVTGDTVATPFAYDLTELTTGTTYYFKAFVQSTTESITVKAVNWLNFITL